MARGALASPSLAARGSPARIFILVALVPLGGCAGLGAGESDVTRLGVGEPCIVTDESNIAFSGFSELEVNIEDGGSCGTGGNVCLTHDFRGRATCPSGQAGAEAGVCRTPAGDAVVVPVEAQLPERPAELGMICSCRCDGPDPNAHYCDCPSGMRCEELLSSRAGAVGDEYVGSYCVY